MIKLIKRCILQVLSWGKVCIDFLVRQVKKCFLRKKADEYNPRQEKSANKDNERNTERCLMLGVAKPLLILNKTIGKEAINLCDIVAGVTQCQVLVNMFMSGGAIKLNEIGRSVTPPLAITNKTKKYKVVKARDRWDGSGGTAMFCEVRFQDEMRSGI